MSTVQYQRWQSDKIRTSFFSEPKYILRRLTQKEQQNKMSDEQNFFSIFGRKVEVVGSKYFFSSERKNSVQT